LHIFANILFSVNGQPTNSTKTMKAMNSVFASVNDWESMQLKTLLQQMR